MIRASDTQVRVIAPGEVAACHARSYDRNQLISLPDHRLEALKLRSRVRAHDILARASPATQSGMLNGDSF